MRPAHHSCAQGVSIGVCHPGDTGQQSPQPHHHEGWAGAPEPGPWSRGGSHSSTPVCTPVAEAPAGEQPWIRCH